MKKTSTSQSASKSVNKKLKITKTQTPAPESEKEQIERLAKHPEPATSAPKGYVLTGPYMLASDRKILDEAKASKVMIPLPADQQPLDIESRVKFFIKRDKNCFSDKFISKAIELAFKKDFPDLNKRTDIHVITDDVIVARACKIQRISCEIVSRDSAPDVNFVLPFWDGMAHESLPPEIVSQNASSIAKWLTNYNKDGEQYFTNIKDQYPPMKFRATTLLYKTLKRGIVPTEDYCIEQLHKWEDIRNSIADTLGSDPEAPINFSLRETTIVATRGNGLSGLNEDAEDLVDETHDQLIEESVVKRRLHLELNQAKFQVLFWGQAIINQPEFAEKNA